MPRNSLSILLVVLYAVYPILSFIYIQKLYQKLEESNGRVPVLFLAVFVLLNGIFIAILGLYSYGVWWFLILPLCLISPIIGVIGVGKMIENRGGKNSSNPIYSLFSVLLIASFLFSPFLSLEMKKACDSFTRNQANPLISGIENYKNQQGVFPDNFSKIIPGYIQKLPTATCLKPYKLFDGYHRGYKIEYCEDNSLLLTVESTDLDWVLIYNFSYHQWLQYEHDDYCGCSCPEINKP